MLRLLQGHGWVVVRIRGSHHHLRKGDDEQVIILPIHGKQELRKGLQEQILKEAGLK